MSVRRGLVTLCMVFVAAPSLALERPELTVGAGFHMLGSMDAAVNFPLSGTQYGEINIVDSGAWSAALDIPLKSAQGGRIELRYCYQPTSLEFEPGIDEELFDLDVHTMLVGFLVERAPEGAPVVPFGGLGLGATYYAPGDGREGETRFTAALNFGLTKYVNEKFGLTLRGDLFMPIDWSGGSMWVGSGGAQVSLGGTSYMAQVGLGAGLTYRFGG